MNPEKIEIGIEQKGDIEQELQLKETLEKFVEDLSPELCNRTAHFGLEKSIVEETNQDISESFHNSVTGAKEFGERLKLKIRLADFITNKISSERKSDKEKSELLNLLEQKLSSEQEFFSLLNRKFQGEITSEEKELLQIFLEVEDKGRQGGWNSLSGKMEISLFGSVSIEGYRAIAMHEFTHKALSTLTPEKIKEERTRVGIGRGFMAIPKLKELDEEEPPEEKEKRKIQEMFFEILEGTDESLAHRVEKYYGKMTEPSFVNYSKKVYPKFFKEIYTEIDNATGEKSLEKFDYFAKDLWDILVSGWKEDLSETELRKIITTVKSKIIDFENEKNG